jgi:hypothetical protein
MSETNERSAAMRVSQGPAAWAAFADDSGETGVTSLNRKAVEEVAARMGWQVSALYSEPTLTDEEREAIGIVADWASGHLGEDDPGVMALVAFLGRAK